MLRKSIAGSLLLLAAGASNAAQLTVNDYSMLNGNSAGYSYWDESYTPSPSVGCTTTDNCALSGGKGDLTDGIIASSNWNITEAPAGNGPYVGWTLDPTITFNFGAVQTINSVTFYLDDANGAGNVSAPSSITITAGAYSNTFSVTDPASGDPFAFTASLPSVLANSVSAQLARKNSWVFLSEVTFNGSPAAVPEPSTYALLLTGLGFVGFVAERRRKQQTAA